MRVNHRWALTAAVAVLGVTLAACGGGSAGSSSTSSAGKSGGTIKVTVGSAPDSLDPGLGANTQSSDVNWITHLGLVSYKHKPGEEGYELVPALAKTLPTVSSDGLVYTLMLRDGMKYSDGTTAKASDFAHAVERNFKLKSSATGFLSAIKGAAEFDAGKADSISGITADDATGQITITLTKPYGALTSVLGLPALGLVPATTPMTADIMAPGVGAYKLTDAADPTSSYAIEKVASFAKLGIPDIPVGKLDKIEFNVVSNNQSAATSVLDGTADVFDAHDAIPPALLAQVRSKAKNRYALRPSSSVVYFWMNTEVAPFNNVKVRQAVSEAISRKALAKLSSGQVTPECFYLPKGFPGHPSAACPWQTADGEPKLADAKKLIQESGLAGTAVTVWGQSRSPRKEWVQYMASVLDSIGLKADVKTLSDSVYYTSVGNEKTKAQIGTASFEASFADPYSLYIALDPETATATNAYNLARAKDPKIASDLANLTKEPVSDPATKSGWAALDTYATDQAYHAVFGTLGYPQFYSERMAFSPSVFHTNFANDWSLMRLK